jgi:hypothetical protein
MGLSEEESGELTELLSALSQLQAKALENSAYIKMSKEEAKQYDQRSTRIAEVRRRLGKYLPL